MDFEFAHDIPASADEVCEALLDEEYQRSLEDVTALAGRELLRQEAFGNGRVRRQIRCVLDVQMNSTARRFIGDSDPAWIEHSEWDPETRTWSWDIHPEVGGGLLEARGEIVVDGDGANGTQRRVRGTVKVSVPLYGGKVESMIVGGLERAYEEEAERLARWINRS